MEELTKWTQKWLEDKKLGFGISVDEAFKNKAMDWFLTFYINDFDTFSYIELPIAIN